MPPSLITVQQETKHNRQDDKVITRREGTNGVRDFPSVGLRVGAGVAGLID